MDKTMTYILAEQDTGISASCFLIGRWEDAQEMQLTKKTKSCEFYNYFENSIVMKLKALQ